MSDLILDYEGLPVDLVQNVRQLYWFNCRLYLSRMTGIDPGPQERRVANYDGGIDRLGRHQRPFWPKLARYYLQNGREPDEAMSAVFAAWSQPRPPSPKQVLAAPQLLPPNALNTHDELRIKIKCQQDTARRAIKKMSCTNMPTEEIHHRVIINRTLDISPLLRICLIYQARLPQLAEHFFDDAVRQYIVQADAYDDVLGPDLPEVFRRVARRKLGSMLLEKPELRSRSLRS